MNGNSPLLLFLIFLFFQNLTNVHSQNLRVIYRYEFKMDSLNRSEKNEEIMILDSYKNKSFFYSYEKFTYDSIMKSKYKDVLIQKTANLDFTNIIDKSKINFSVSKNLSNSEKVLHLMLDLENYAIKDRSKINWNVVNEKKKIRNIEVQKATTNYLGRSWIAWFSSDYPIQNGPYKFDGLPGLILEIYDEKNDHIFTLLSIKKTNENFVLHKNNEKSEIDVNNEEFNKLWNKYKNDPAKSYRNRILDSGIGYSISMNGISKPNEIIREIEKNEKEKIRNFNNFIEINLFR